MKITARHMLLLSVGVLAAPAADDGLIFERIGGRVMDRAIFLPAGEFTTARVKDLAHQFFRDTHDRFVLARLTIGSTKESAVSSLWQVRLQTTYSDESEMVRTLGQPKGPVARVLIWNGTGVLSIRDGANLTTEGLGRPQSAIAFHEAGRSYELLHFVLWPSGAGANPQNKYDLTLYLRAQPRYSISSCYSLTRRLRMVTAVRFLSIDVRPDTWFFSYTSYPYVLPFVSLQRLPPEGEFEGAPTVGCRDSSRTEVGTVCSGQGLVP